MGPEWTEFFISVIMSSVLSVLSTPTPNVTLHPPLTEVFAAIDSTKSPSPLSYTNGYKTQSCVLQRNLNTIDRLGGGGAQKEILNKTISTIY